MLASMIFPTAKSANITTMRITVNDAMSSISEDTPPNHCASHFPSIEENLKDSHTPRIIDIIETTCATRPLLSPFITAGMKQMRIIISRIFIFYQS